MAITEGEIGLDRDDQELLLPDTCVRSRPTYIDDGRGGQTEGTPATATYACRLSPTTGREVEVAAQATEQVTLTVTLPHDADVRAEDTLTVASRSLQVVAVLRGGAWMSALRVLAVER